MPSTGDLTKQAYSFRQWLTYYHNIWARNVIAHTIDVQYDEILRAENPETPVPFNSPVGTVEMPVKERLEHRKMNLEHALKTLAAIEALEAKTDEELAARWSPEALKVAEDVITQE